MSIKVISTTYKAEVIVSLKGKPDEELQLQTRSLQDAIDGLPPEGVLVRVQAAGVCHSDLYIWRGHYKIGKNDSDIFEFIDHPELGTPPIIPGHEIAGLVHTMGEKASETCCLSVGDRVIVYPWTGCNNCPVCLEGDANFCPVLTQDVGFHLDGGYAEFVQVLHWRYVLKLPESISFSLGALLPCGALTSFSALRKCVQVANRVCKWKRDVIVAVCGLGGLGQWALNLLPFCLGRDGVKVVGMDRREVILSKVSEFIHYSFHMCPADTVDQQVQRFEEKFQFHPDIVLDFVNSTETFALNVKLLARSGIHVMVGLYGGIGELQLPLAALSSSIHTGHFTGSLYELEELVKVVAENDISPPFMKEYRLKEATQALNDLDQGLVNGRAVLIMEEHSPEQKQ